MIAAIPRVKMQGVIFMVNSSPPQSEPRGSYSITTPQPIVELRECHHARVFLPSATADFHDLFVGQEQPAAVLPFQEPDEFRHILLALARPSPDAIENLLYLRFGHRPIYSMTAAT
jgi:hypothetical protein